jgi:hypothetical protein
MKKTQTRNKVINGLAKKYFGRRQKCQNNQKRLKFQNQLGVTIAFACLSGFGDMFLKDAREFRKSAILEKCSRI